MGIEKIDKAWDREVDVIVLGAGPAGMAAAIVSKNEGQEPLILEKTDQVGGTGAWSVGMMWFVDSSPMRAAGFKDSSEKARRYFAATVGNKVAVGTAGRVYRTGPRRARLFAEALRPRGHGGRLSRLQPRD